MQMICNHQGDRMMLNIPEASPWILTSTMGPDQSSVELVLQVGSDLRLTLMHSLPLMLSCEGISLRDVDEVYQDIIEAVRRVFEQDHPRVLDLETIQSQVTEDWKEVWKDELRSGERSCKTGGGAT